MLEAMEINLRGGEITFNNITLPNQAQFYVDGRNTSYIEQVGVLPKGSAKVERHARQYDMLPPSIGLTGDATNDTASNNLSLGMAISGEPTAYVKI